MTKKQYIEEHGKSYLARNLQANNWPDDAEIILGGGLDAPHTKQSNLYAALAESKSREYCLGGHRKEGTQGWWWAVRK